MCVNIYILGFGLEEFVFALSISFCGFFGDCLCVCQWCGVDSIKMRLNVESLILLLKICF